jgi:alpha-beta hydrolase superfamily lysophospholipase
MTGQLQHYQASDGVQLAYHHWAVQDPRGAVVYLHGIQSHAGWYTASCERLQAEGFEVLFVDRRGSGVNEAGRGDARHYRVLIDDLASLVEQRIERVAGRPRVLIGLSWGGKLAVGLTKIRPDLVDALALVCPGLFPQVAPPLRQRLAIGLCAVVRPRRLFDIPLSDPALFTDNPAQRRYIAEDPLSLRRATARLLAASVKLDWFLRDAPEQIHVPSILYQAGRDRIVDNDRTRAYFERFACKDRVVKCYSESHHTLEFSVDPVPFFDHLTGWLRRVSEAAG